MYGDMGIFEDYMGVQYDEGRSAYKKGISKKYNPYDEKSEMGLAWIDGWNDEHLENKSHCED